jgi:hypothetical protein
VAIAQLQAAGHRVERCHEPGARAFPCAALNPGRCPLEDGEIDVVLTVRARSHPRPSPLEDGVTCALRRHVPVVVAGRTGNHPFQQYDVAVAGVDDVVETCERAATGPQRDHEAAATRALHQTLDVAGLPLEGSRVEVHRTGAGLRANVYVPRETGKRQRDIVAVRVVGALRAFDRSTKHIEIDCEVLP